MIGKIFTEWKIFYIKPFNLLLEVFVILISAAAIIINYFYSKETKKKTGYKS